MVEIVRVPGTAKGEKTRGWFFDFYNQWPAVFQTRKNNWVDWRLTLFQIAGENSPYKRSWEVEFGLLGFSVTATYVYREDYSDLPDLLDRASDKEEATHATTRTGNEAT